MTSHSQQLISPYSVPQLFAMVADVERYPDFLPWCRAARILTRQEGEFYAELVIAFKGVSERYTSRVVTEPAGADGVARIDVTMVEGPFEHLINRWQFTPLAGGNTQIDFFLDFKFKSFLLGKLIGPIFGSAASQMGEAFQERADALYEKAGA